MKLFLKFFLGFLLVSSLGACGQSGRLYLPKDEPMQPSTPTSNG